VSSIRLRLACFRQKFMSDKNISSRWHIVFLGVASVSWPRRHLVWIQRSGTNLFIIYVEIVENRAYNLARLNYLRIPQSFKDFQALSCEVDTCHEQAPGLSLVWIKYILTHSALPLAQRNILTFSEHECFPMGPSLKLRYPHINHTKFSIQT
jgi:hypothetical protein